MKMWQDSSSFLSFILSFIVPSFHLVYVPVHEHGVQGWQRGLPLARSWDIPVTVESCLLALASTRTLIGYSVGPIAPL